MNRQPDIAAGMDYVDGQAVRDTSYEAESQARAMLQMPWAKFAVLAVCVAALAALSTWLVWRMFESPDIGTDDANIFFVYAQNLIGGHGFVYNPGGERVEGFTSLLWVLVCSAAFAVSKDPEHAILVVSVGLMVAGVLFSLTSQTFRRDHPGAHAIFWMAGYLLLVFSDFSFVTWNTITLMDNALWTTLLLSAVVVSTSAPPGGALHRFLLPLLAALLVLTRPEALLWVPVLLTVAYGRGFVRGNHPLALRAALPGLLAYIAAVLLLTGFRLVYFGYPLPNTYYAKVSPSLVDNLVQGAQYLGLYVLSGPIVCLATLSVVLSLLQAVHKRRFEDNPATTMAAVAAVGLVIPALNGGDHFGAFRFYQSIYPLLLLSLIGFLRLQLPQMVALQGGQATRRFIVASTLGCLACAYLAYKGIDFLTFPETSRLSHEFGIGNNGRNLGRFAQDTLGDGRLPSLGVTAAGGVKYAYPGEVVDLMGLNNLRMAHNGGSRSGLKNHAAFEKSTFYELQPDIVTPFVHDRRRGAPVDFAKDPHYRRILRNLFDEQRFREMYTLGQISRADRKDSLTLAGWFRRDYVRELATAGRLQIELLDREEPSPAQ